MTNVPIDQSASPLAVITGASVTPLQPGPTETSFFHRAHLEDTKLGASKKDDPADVARDGFEAMIKGKDHVVTHMFNTKAQAALSEILSEPTKAQVHRKESEPGSAERGAR